MAPAGTRQEAGTEREQGGSAVFAIERFLAAERAKDLLRFSTAGSVDDGKSTLIGRLLYDSRNVYEDQVRAVTRASSGGSGRAAIDFALLTDGLRAEREQGITIDVAYRFFSTARRKFIIADTPGHVEYTRNMATGASTADVAVILVDAAKGIVTQSRRHAYIAALLGIPRVVAAINKMDLVDWSEERFRRLEADFQRLAGRVGLKRVTAIPLSALEGDNVVHPSRRMAWYEGPSLLEYLENVETADRTGGTAFRLPVQRVILANRLADRPPFEHPGQRQGEGFRGFAGQIAAGTVRPGDRVVALPSGRGSRIRTIVTFDGELDEASAPLSVTVTLEDELDISRGDMIAAAGQPPAATKHFRASMVWLDQRRLAVGRRYLLKHSSRTVPARVGAVRGRVNLETLEMETLEMETREGKTPEAGSAQTLELNGIGEVEVETDRPILADLYGENRATGSFILIDLETNSTAGAGMIREVLGRLTDEPAEGGRAGARKIALAPRELVERLEERLLALGAPVVRTRARNEHLWRAVEAAGAIVLVETDGTAEDGPPRVLAGDVAEDLIDESEETVVDTIAAALVR